MALLVEKEDRLDCQWENDRAPYFIYYTKRKVFPNEVIKITYYFQVPHPLDTAQCSLCELWSHLQQHRQ